MTDTSRGLPERPMSPHTTIWRWHITMACSILHRACVVGLWVGAVILASWGAALAAGPEAYAGFLGVLGSPIGKLVLVGETFAVFYNVAYTIRQSFWDIGKGFAPRIADMTGAMSIAFAVVATIVTWVIAGANGAF